MPAFPPAFRGLSEPQLQALVNECDKPTAEQKLDEWARQPLPHNPLDKLRGIEPPAPGAPQVPAVPLGALERVIARPKAHWQPSRRKVSFLHHVARCTTVTEAAARAGLDRSTVYRWKDKDAAFAKGWLTARGRLNEETLDDLSMRANRPTVRAVFYRASGSASTNATTTSCRCGS